MVKTPLRSTVLGSLPHALVEALEKHAMAVIKEEDLHKCLTPERLEFVLQEDPRSKPYTLLNSEKVTHLFWPTKDHLTTKKFYLEKDNSDRLKRVTGPIRNQWLHKICGFYVVCDMISSARLLHGLDKEFRPLSPMYLFRNVNQERFVARQRQAAMEDLEHCCAGSSMIGGFQYAKVHGVPEEKPENKVFDCVQGDPLEDGEVLYKLKDLYSYPSLDIAMQRLKDGYPVAAGLVTFKGWNKYWVDEINEGNMIIYEGPASGRIFSGNHGVIIIDIRKVRGILVAICKSSNGEKVGNMGYLAVSLEIMLMVICAEEGLKYKFCNAKPQYLLSEFHSVDVEMGSEPLIQVDPERAREHMTYRVMDYQFPLYPEDVPSPKYAINSATVEPETKPEPKPEPEPAIKEAMEDLLSQKLLKGFKASVVEPAKRIEQADRVIKALDDNILDGDALARFGARESEKFCFLGVDRRDAKRRRPTDENYDPRKLYLPPDFVKRLTGGQRQWWEFKSNHMDKVVFFKMGKFYELFEMDAHVGAKELDLQYMKGDQPHCGFPEKNFSVNIEKLVNKGYRVLVVEQTETPDQLERRRKEKGSKDKVVKREICAVVTRGTLTDGDMLLTNPDASYLMALTEGGESLTDQEAEHNFGVCLVDVATKKIILGQFKDDQDCSALSCLLSETRPVEIIKPANVLSSATERTVVRHTRNPLVNNLVPLSEFWDAEKTIHEVGIFYKRISCQPSSAYSGDGSLNNESGSSALPKMLSELASGDKNGSLALSALGGAIYYLRQAFLDESLLRFAKFESLPYCDFSNFAEKQHMVLDAAALENLEIFENSRNGGFSGTLYAQLNQCVTASGKRLLKTWLARPLYNLELIKERQDAVAILRGENLPYSLEFRKALSRLPDMERLIARIFSSIEASGRNGDKVVLYEDVAKKKLQEFISTLRGCETMVDACSSLRVILKHDKSRRLLRLLTPGQSLPNISSSIKYFKDAFDWVEAHNSGRVVPHEGADEEYDFTCKAVKELESSLTKHLKEQRKLLGDASINYVTVGKDEYLLEVPESLSGHVPQDYELCSSKKGVFRYWTPTIKKLLKELSQAKTEQESALKSISQRLIGRFCEHQEEWRQLVSVTAELDVLISLAFASDSYEGVRCRPVISGSTSDDVPHLSATGLGHPVLRGDSLGRGSFVPNDVKIGGSKQASFILLTGPNMGGKSTLLRQVCLAVILAQIGADVPAETFELSPVDRIFVRMGAKDHIMAGQSTFLTELSETAVMLSSATRNSLVVLDELGRGTATSDGQAIAESVLEHFIEKVQCRGMFSTHYHRLSMDYKTNPKVSLCHMACQVGEGTGGVEEVTFLYRLTPGACPKSYGVNVARLAGLPDYVLERAMIKSQEFESLYGKNHRKSDHKVAEMMRQIISSVSSDSDCSTSKDSLSELHSMANTFLRL